MESCSAPSLLLTQEAVWSAANAPEQEFGSCVSFAASELPAELIYKGLVLVLSSSKFSVKKN